MSQTSKVTLLPSTMIGIAMLAIFDINPEGIAQWASMVLLALFSGVCLGSSRCCSRRGA